MMGALGAALIGFGLALIAAADIPLTQLLIGTVLFLTGLTVWHEGQGD